VCTTFNNFASLCEFSLLSVAIYNTILVLQPHFTLPLKCHGYLLIYSSIHSQVEVLQKHEHVSQLGIQHCFCL